LLCSTKLQYHQYLTNVELYFQEFPITHEGMPLYADSLTFVIQSNYTRVPCSEVKH
jgi:hypothetical protein